MSSNRYGLVNFLGVLEPFLPLNPEAPLNARTAPLAYFCGKCLGKELEPLSELPRGS